MPGDACDLVLVLFGGAKVDEGGEIPGTSMRLNSYSTLVLVEGRMSPNWALFAPSPTIFKDMGVEDENGWRG